jgi:hypothetical protein
LALPRRRPCWNGSPIRMRRLATFCSMVNW